jgi:hypothetical protein
MDNNNTSINVEAIAMSIKDRIANNFLLNACEDNETVYALLKLFNEFGIYGERLMVFINRLNSIVETSKGLGLIEPYEEEESDG